MSEKKLSISKKTVLIASALVLAVGLPIAYLLWTRNQEDTGAWYNSSWLYRRSISVGNPGSTLTNEDVLIEYDTAALVTAGKLLSTCNDLRFVDSDDSTALAYWVEGGCNTTTTHIWVRIPSLPAGGKTIYMYYGNSSATNAEETWTGKFYIMKDASCDSGWTTESNSGGDFYLKFPYPASTFGSTGGASSHNHGSYNMNTSTISTGTNTNTSGTNSISIGHYHNVDVVVADNTSVLPPYLDMIFCSNNDLIVKTNGVTVFTSTVPSGFTQFSALDSKFPRGNSSYGGTSTATTHTHDVTATTGNPSSTGTNATGATAIPSGTHTHTATADVTGTGNQVPSYITVIFGEAASADVMAPSAMITMSNGTPPLGWTRYSALDSNFTYGSTTYGSTGGTSTHTHSVPALSFPQTTSTVSGSTSTPRTSLPRANHTHTTSSTTSNTYSNTPPYVSTLFIQKKTSQSVTVNSEEVPNQSPNAPSALTTEGSTNPTGVTDLTPEFSSLYTDPDSDDAAYYQIEVNTQSDFLGTVMWDSTKTAATITHNTRSAEIPYGDSDLTQNGTTYYWRMKYWDDNGAASSWSSTANFTMANPNNNPDAPSSLLTETTTNPTKVEDTTPEFSAVFTDDDTADTGVYYQIEVNTQSDFLGTVMWDSTKTATGPITNGARSSDISYGDSDLTFNGVTYYWRMKFWDNNAGESAWSSTANFTMASVPNAPTSLQTEGATNPTGVTDLTPEFSAVHTDTDGDSTTHYEIEVNTQSDFLGTSMWDSGQQTITVAHNARSADISYGDSDLTLNGATYYWRIRFWDSQGVSTWSSVANFTMYSNTAPNAPSSLLTETATNPIKVTDTTPEFSAIHTDPESNSTASYQIEVNTQSDFLGTVMWDSGKQSITVAHNARSSDIPYGDTDLTLNGATYYWRIKFWDIYDAASSWSSTAQFTMSGVPYAPTSLQTEGATNPTGVTDLTPEFNAVHTDPNEDSTTHYEIEVNTQSDFLGTVMWDSGQQTITVAHNARSADISYGDSDLTLNGATYYWRIRFWDSVSTVSDWSSTANFTMYSNTAPNAPSSLYAEAATNPIKVTDTTPEFSAIHTDPESNSTASYQIEVNTQSDFLGTVMWDSGKQSITVAHNARSSDIPYGDTDLTLNGATYYWRIKFWDIYDAASSWSSTAQFTMSGVPYAPTSLQTEGATNPTGVTDLTPEFSAIHTDPNEDSTTHYEIEVNTQSDFLGTSMWDSGQQTITVAHNARSADISYGDSDLTLNGATYYWRIRFWDSVSTVSDWSSTGNFTMATSGNTNPDAPSSLLTETATNPIKVTDTTPEFSAVFTDTDASDTGVYYQIEVNTQSDFLGTVMWDSTKTATGPITNGARSSDISYGDSDLTLNGVTYYWRMKFWDNNAGESAWSSTAQFTMSGVPNAPTSLQTEGATNPTGVTDLTPEFSAIHTDPNTDSTTHYEIEVNTQSDFLGTVMWDSNQTAITVAHNARSADISYGDTDLALNGATYYWRIRFWDSLGVSNWSSTANFTMYSNTTPNAPSSLYAETSTNPIKVTDTTPEFSAIFTDTNGSDTGNYYQIEVNTQSDFLGTVMWDSTKTATGPITNGARSSDISYGDSDLTLNGVTYYWRMKFWDNYDAESSWSSTAQFTMSGVPNAPTSLQTEGATNPTGVTDTTPEFSAIHTDPNQDSTTHYEIEVNTQSDFLGTVMWDSNQTAITVAHNARSADISYGDTDLTLNGTTYYWRIRFWDSQGVSNWSSTANFTMGTNTSPNAPSSLQTESTTNPTKVADTTPEFSAVFTDTNPSDTGNYYEIEVNTASNFGGTVMWDSNQTAISPITNGTRSSEISYGETNLTQNGATYYWRIKFWDSNGAASNWSSTAQFTMSGPPNLPSSIKVDGMTNPTKIFSLTPSFAAYHTDNNADSAIYYEIEVNPQADFLGTPMWDTNKTSMTSTPNNQYCPDITYAGTALTGTSNTTYYWRIRFWDSETDVSEWSTTGTFVDFLDDSEYVRFEGIKMEGVKIN